MTELIAFLFLTAVGLGLVAGADRRTAAVLRLPQPGRPLLVAAAGGACLLAALVQEIAARGVEVGIVRGLLLLSVVGVVVIGAFSAWTLWIRGRAQAPTPL